MKKFLCFITTCIIILINVIGSIAQDFQGPEPGIPALARTVSTFDKFLGAVGKPPMPRGYEGNIDVLKRQPYIPIEGVNAQEDLSARDLIPEPLAPPLLDNFEGFSYTGWIPPDPIIAVGTNDIVVAVNSSFAIYSKSGIKQFEVTLADWFSSSLPPSAYTNGPFDPWVIYDQHSNRFVLIALATNTSSKKSWYLLTTPQQSSPFGSWWAWALDATLDGSTPTNNWADYEKLGVDNTALYITSNQFAFGGGFQYAKLRILNKAKVYSGSALSWYDFWNLKNTDGSMAFTVQPAHIFGAPGVEYLVNSQSGSGSSYTLWKLTNPLGSPTLTKTNVLTASYSAPPDAEQKGSSTRIDTGDARLLNAVYRNGSLYTVHNVAYDWETPTSVESVARYVQIDTSTLSVVLNVTYGADGSYYYYPAVMVDASGIIMTVFNRSGPSEYAGARYSARPIGGPFENSAYLKEGVASYVQLDKEGRNRWGDYSGIALDPFDESQVWIFSEYVSSTNKWGTWIGATEFSAPPPQKPDLTVTSINAPSSAKHGDSIDVSFTVKNQGDASSGSFYNCIYLATTPWGTDISLGNFSMSSISAGSSSSDTKNVKIPDTVSSGDYYVTVFTDCFQVVDESNEGNNIGSTYPNMISIKPISKNPPIASASDISGQPKVMYPDTLYEVTAKYYDPDGRTNLYLCSLGLIHPTAEDIVVGWSEDLDMPIEDSPYITFLNVDSTPITGTYEGYRLTWKFKISDTWPEAENSIDFGVVAVDDDGLQSSWDIDNTNASFIKPPDLIVQNPAITSSGPYYPGSSLSVSCVIKNQGKGTASPSKVKYYLSTSSTGTDYYLGYDDVGSLSAGGTSPESKTVTIPSDITCDRNYYVVFYADADGQVSESDESNNKNNAGTIYVQCKPKAPTVTITEPSSDPYTTTSATITIRVACSDEDGDLSRVKLYNNANGYQAEKSISGSSYNATFENVPLVEGNNLIEVTVYDSGGRTGTDTVTVIYKPGQPPIADFEGKPTQGCAPLTVQFTDKSTGNPTSWSWTFGDGETSTVQNPSHIYANPGKYTVSLTALNQFGSDIETKTDYITALPKPTADFVANPTSGYAPLTVQFTDKSTGNPTSWQWNFGDGGSSSEQNPSHTYNNPGTFTVSLTATNDCGSDTETKSDYIEVKPPQKADFTWSPEKPKEGEEIQFTDQSTPQVGIVSWSWSFGDGGTRGWTRGAIL